MSRPRILCISLSPISRDARVLRQLSVLAEYGDVTTVGYGTAPAYGVHHIEVPSDKPSLPQTVLGVARLALRRVKASELAAPGVAYARDALLGSEWDLVVANEARILALAFAVAGGAPVWADMHEWAPEERTHVLSWRLLVAPLMDHLCRVYLPRCAAVTTVGREIARLYRERYGIEALVMRNSPAYVELDPSPLDGDRIRLVHSGGAVPGRNIEGMIDAVIALDDRFTLDFYLVPAARDNGYLASLERRAAGTDRIRFHHPVAPSALPATLQAYDVGVYWMPPTHTNARLALPNKLFDFVQGRLAVAIGPTIEMARIVREHELGVVSEGFDVDQCVRSLANLTAASVAAFKANSAAAARELSFERDADVGRSIVTELLGFARADAGAAFPAP